MASTPSQLLIVCPHCCHAMTEQEGQLRCRSCQVAWPLPAWQGSAPPGEVPPASSRPQIHAAA